MQNLTTWLAEHSLLSSILAGASLSLLAVTIWATPWAVSRLPSDYLLQSMSTPSHDSPKRPLLSTCRAILGLFITLLGLIMMLTPGPGVVMILLGISIADFPGKNRLLLYLATRPNVLASLNWMRRRHGQSPFVIPEADR